MPPATPITASLDVPEARPETVHALLTDIAAWRLWSPHVASVRPDHGTVRAGQTVATRAFFSGAAHAWDRLRVELFGARADLIALLALLDDRMTVGDLGCGTGAVADLLAPFVGRVVAVDHSREMLDVARRRLDGRTNVELREGDLEALPVADGELDAALLVLTLHHMPDPEAVFAEAARTLRPGGRLVVIDMAPHDREGYRAEMGHVWLGFGEAQLAPWLRAAGFGPARYALLPADPAARGPALFAAAAALARAAGTPPAPEALGACRPDADSLGSTAPPDAPAPDAAPRTQTLITVP